MFRLCGGDREPFKEGVLELLNFTERVYLPTAVGYADFQRKTTPYLVSASTTRYGVIFLCPTAILSLSGAVGHGILHKTVGRGLAPAENERLPQTARLAQSERCKN